MHLQGVEDGRMLFLVSKIASFRWRHHTLWFMVLMLIFVFLTSAFARSPFYEPGDWVSYTNLSFVTSIA